MKYITFFLLITVAFGQSSRIELKTHFSPTLGITKQYNIFFPAGYDSETDHYPVLYLFRGAVDEWADPYEDASRRGTIKTVFDTLYEKGRVGKMILIMPGLGAPAATNEYNYIINDLIPYIDSTFRTIPTRWHRGMDGFSLGGLIVTNLLASAPQYFCSVGSYDGTLSLFSNSLFSNASTSLIYAMKQMQLLYHTASSGGNSSNNQTTFGILNSKGIYNALPSFILHQNAVHNWYNADWHMGVTLPLHWQKMKNAENSLNGQFTAQFNLQKRSGTVVIPWQRTSTTQKTQTMLFVSSDNGAGWTQLLTTRDSVQQFSWNTSLHPDGTVYKLKLLSAADTLFGYAEMLPFTVDNPGNGVPDLFFLSMSDTLRGNGAVQFYAADADGDPLNLTIRMSYNDGQTWVLLDSNIATTGSYPIDFTLLPNSNSVRFALRCTDGTVEKSVVSKRHIIANKRYTLTNANVLHVTGNSDALITVTANNPATITPGKYDIVFQESNGKKTYSVFNSLGTEIVKNATELDGVSEGPLFNGMRLLIRDLPKPVVQHDSTRWIVGTSPLAGYTTTVDLYLETDTVVAIPSPYDYEIRIANSIVDTTLGLYGTTPQMIPFSVWNTTLNRKTKIVYVEIDMNGTLSRNDELFIIEKDSTQQNYLSWHVQFLGIESDPNPVPGDKFKIRVQKPLTKNDSYSFNAIPTSVRRSGSVPLQYSMEQNYPNLFNPATTIRYSVPEKSDVTLSVYDLLGRDIAVLVNKTVPAGVYNTEWNAAAHSSGVYFFRFRAGAFTQTRKMVLLR